MSLCLEIYRQGVRIVLYQANQTHKATNARTEQIGCDIGQPRNFKGPITARTCINMRWSAKKHLAMKAKCVVLYMMMSCRPQR